MTPEEIRSILLEGLENAEVQADGDGSHFQVIAVSEQFEGQRSVKRQQAISALYKVFC